jgi:hypothetical protein
MAQFTLADVPGAFNRGLQFRQQNEIRPLEIAAAQQNVANAEQNFRAGEQNLKAGEQNMQFKEVQQRALEQDIDIRNDDQRNQSLYDVAFKTQNARDEEIIPILKAQIANVAKLGGDSTASQKALALAETGDFNGVRQGAKNIIDVGISQGDLKAPDKPTSSNADFKTYQGLLEKAARTGSTQDAQFAQQFGMQAGFERDTPQELANIDVDKESRKALVKQASVASKEAFDGLKNIRSTLANMGDAITALDDGAETGPIVSRLPSLRAASIELDNIKGRMGLDVISSVTFGALSESELAFALDTALPTKLEKEPLKLFLKNKVEAQKKLATELRKAASFLGTPGNTIADYVDILEKEAVNKEQDELDTLKKYGL